MTPQSAVALAAAAAVGAFLVLGASAQARPAVSGAAGFGANAAGGRGGDVYHVTSLADTLTPGTLRFGLRESGFPALGRTIVFDVGGVINLTSNLDIKNISNVTVAGQTAPGAGITLAGRTLQITGSNNKQTSNIVFQHIAVRGPVEEDAISIKGAGHTHNILVDHVSTSWSDDELLSATQSINNITVSNSFITEALNPSGHAYGSLVRPLNDSTLTTSSVTYHHNLYANNKSRNPRPGTYDGKLLNFEFVNNVIYNWSDRAGYSGGSSEGDTEFVRMNYLGNHLIAGPITPTSATTVAFTKDAGASPIDLKVYQSGNVIDSNKNLLRDGVNSGWGMFRAWNGSTLSAFAVADQMADPFAFPMTQFDSAQDAYERVLAAGGATPWARSAVDQRLASNVKNQTGTVVNSLPVEWTQILATPQTSRPAGFDTDNDGMPNAWETARGTNPNAADHNAIAANGSSNLENYLNALSLQAVWNVDADASWGGILNWAGERPNSDLASATFGGNITAPRTIALDAPGVVIGQINFNSAQPYTIAPGVGGSLLVDVVSGTAEFAVTNGQHVISAPVTLADTLEVDVAPGSKLEFQGDLTGGGKRIVKTGAGDAAAGSVRSAELTLSAGIFTLSAGASSSQVNLLSIAAGATLDLNNALVIAAADAANNAAGIRGLLTDGRLISSAADANHAIGYGDNEILNLTMFADQQVAPDDTLLRITRLGDANLDGTTNITDFAALAANFNAAGEWTSGDFNRDGAVNIGDFAILAANFNQTSAAPARLVPEPAAAASILFCGAILVVRRKK